VGSAFRSWRLLILLRFTFGLFVALKLKGKEVHLDLKAGIFYNAAIAVTAFRALGVNPGKNRYAEDSNPGRWFRS